jgi:hypothetical protein
MASITRTTAIGVFARGSDAQAAVRDLRSAGFAEEDIGVAARDLERSTAEGTRRVAGEGESQAEEGAVTGGAGGGGLGALGGLGFRAGLWPPIGPAIAGGTLAAILSSAAAGAAAAGIAGALIGAGIPEDEASYYESEFQAGRTIFSVRANGRYDEAMSVLARHGAYDLSTRDDLPRV